MEISWSHYCLGLGHRTHVMGILNITPDSFSDGGLYFDTTKAVEHGLHMAMEGADIIDVGGESTRPYSQRLSAQEEMDRVIPVISALAQELHIPISIDTYKAQVAREAICAGASMINDVTALRFDPTMASVAAEAQVPLILMHMKGASDTMQVNPVYDDLMGEIADFLKGAIKTAVKAGVREDLILVDPGIGFGKTFDHNLQIIRDLSRLTRLNRPIVLGTSNKAFIGDILGRPAHERDTGTMATVAAGVMKGAQVVRVHQVKKAVETVRIIDAVLRGHGGPMGQTS